MLSLLLDHYLIHQAGITLSELNPHEARFQ
jgi:hypothetical protein